MLRHVKKSISIRWVENLITPLLRDDRLVDYREHEKNFRVYPEKQMARQLGYQLRDAGFTGYYWYGVTKIVYPHSEGFVLKVPIIEDFAPFLVEEVEFFQGVPTRWRRNFAFTACRDENLGLVYQEWAPPCKWRFMCKRAEIRRMERELELCDIHHNNVGFPGYDDPNQFLIIDAQSEASIERLRVFQKCGDKIPL
jgi:hypothetical protein